MTENTQNDILNYLREYTENANIGAKGKLISSVIKNITEDHVVVDAGSKSECLIPKKEFFQINELQNLQIGDTINVYATGKSEKGKMIVSREKAIREETMKHLEECFDKNQRCKGIVFGKVKGGLSMDINGVVAFLPGSQIDFEAIKDVTYLMGKEIDVKVLKIQTKGLQTVIVSRKAILEEDSVGDRSNFISSVKQDMVLKGVVKNITEYGVFVKLHYGVDGLIHINDISWEKISHPSEVLEIGQEIDVKIIKIEEETGKISLGVKQLQDNPWEKIKNKYPLGTQITVEISEISGYEAIADIDDTLEGVINENNIAWGRAESIERFKELKVGDKIKTIVVEIDTDKHRIKLSVKHLTENPADKLLANKEIGQTLEGEIISVQEFGIFVKLAEGVEGKVSTQDITWKRDYKSELKHFNVGDKIKVVYLSKGISSIKLGIKQATDHPFDKYLSKTKVGDVITCEVLDNTDRRMLEVRLFGEITTIIKAEELGVEASDRRTNRFLVGNKLDAKVTMIDHKSKKIFLSVRALESDEYNKTIKKYGSAESGASLMSVAGFANFKDEE